MDIWTNSKKLYHWSRNVGVKETRTYKNNNYEHSNTFSKSSLSYDGIAVNPVIGYNIKLGRTLQSSFVFNANIPTPMSISKSRGDIYSPSFELKAGLGF